MKKSFFFKAALLVAMVGCNKEPQQVEGPDTQEGQLYMQFSVNMLTTRTGTDGEQEYPSDATPDFEVGKDHENTISKVDIVLTNADSYVVAKNVVPAAASKDTYVASFNTLELTAGATYDVYVYANCEAPTAKNIDQVSTESVANITKANNFWMTNAYAPVAKTLPTDLSLYTQPHNPLNLGSHYVERAMARFDYMPINDNKYDILKGETVNATITLTEAALINQSKAFYMFRRVSADGTNTGWVQGGLESMINYVVDTDYEAKAGGYAEGLAANFDYHMTAPAGWDWKSIARADLGEADSWKGKDDGKSDVESTHSLNDFYIWQYAKENTIPGEKVQDHGISTGVVFKGEITGTAVTAADGETIYVFENVLYGKWADVVAASKANDAPATLVAAVNKITAKDAPTTADYAAAGFTGYKPENGKYYAYYYYWNRHNDNGNNTVMGPMEFAVVRNNVYKLCVDKIAKFGHPNPDDVDPIDPDPENPEDPDESINYYFTVTVKVLPWVVRVNHIEF